MYGDIDFHIPEQVGLSYMSQDCSKMERCEMVNSKPSMVTVKRTYCHMHAECVKPRGAPECQCHEGYIGDGINQCLPKPPPGMLHYFFKI